MHVCWDGSHLSCECSGTSMHCIPHSGMTGELGWQQGNRLQGHTGWDLRAVKLSSHEWYRPHEELPQWALSPHVERTGQNDRRVWPFLITAIDGDLDEKGLRTIQWPKWDLRFTWSCVVQPDHLGPLLMADLEVGSLQSNCVYSSLCHNHWAALAWVAPLFPQFREGMWPAPHWVSWQISQRNVSLEDISGLPDSLKLAVAVTRSQQPLTPPLKVAFRLPGAASASHGACGLKRSLQGHGPQAIADSPDSTTLSLSPGEAKGFHHLQNHLFLLEYDRMQPKGE